MPPFPHRTIMLSFDDGTVARFEVTAERVVIEHYITDPEEGDVNAHYHLDLTRQQWFDLVEAIASEAAIR